MRVQYNTSVFEKSEYFERQILGILLRWLVWKSFFF